MQLLTMTCMCCIQNHFFLLLFDLLAVVFFVLFFSVFRMATLNNSINTKSKHRSVDLQYSISAWKSSEGCKVLSARTCHTVFNAICLAICRTCSLQEKLTKQEVHVVMKIGCHLRIDHSSCTVNAPLHTCLAISYSPNPRKVVSHYGD